MEIEASPSVGPELPFLLTEENESDIKVFCDVAKQNGAAISLSDIRLLISRDASEKELETAWVHSRNLSSHYGLDRGIIVERNVNREASDEIVREEKERVSRAQSNLFFAERFAPLCADENTKVLAVSGSTSYMSVSRRDDLDFFCITRRSSMWVFLSRSLLLARAFRFAAADRPWLCLSYVVDDTFAMSEFTDPKDSLFARDALSTVVVRGSDYYTALLRQSAWMSDHFPKLYSLRVRPSTEITGRSYAACDERMHLNSNSEQTGISTRIANDFLYVVVGSYIRLKSYLLNRRLSRSRNKEGVFQLRIGRDHCIYESLSYVRLREMYRHIGRNTQRREER